MLKGGILLEKPTFLLIDKKVLPLVFAKVLEAKTLLSKDIAKNSADACRMVGISRSAFYKYKDSVFYYEEQHESKVMTYSLRLSDEPGVLSKVLERLSAFNVNIITVNQNIPVDKVAVVTISFRTQKQKTDLDLLYEEVSKINGVLRLKQI